MCRACTDYFLKDIYPHYTHVNVFNHYIYNNDVENQQCRCKNITQDYWSITFYNHLSDTYDLKIMHVCRECISEFASLGYIYPYYTRTMLSNRARDMENKVEKFRIMSSVINDDLLQQYDLNTDFETYFMKYYKYDEKNRNFILID